MATTTTATVDRTPVAGSPPNRRRTSTAPSSREGMRKTVGDEHESDGHSEPSADGCALDRVALVGHDHLGAYAEQPHLALRVERPREGHGRLDHVGALARGRRQLAGLRRGEE